jgi:multidrug efflux pump subunit AcrB
MKKFLGFFIRYPITVNVLLFGALIYGSVAWYSLNSTFFPLIPERFVVINAVYPGASPQEVEEGVIAKIEENLKGISGVDRYTSVSSENTGTITVEAFRSANAKEVLDDVENAVNQISSFPSGLEPVTVFLRENLTLTITFSLTGDEISLKSLKTLSRQIEDELRDFEGISKVSLLGFPEEEIEIAVNEEALRAYNLSFQQVGEAVAANNFDITGGSVKTETEEYLIRARNKNYDPTELLDIVVKADAQGNIVRLDDVASVKQQFADAPSAIELDGQTALKLQIENTDSEDILSTAQFVRQYVKEFNARHQKLQATIVNDRADVLEQRKALLIENGLIGIVLVLILLSLFLNFRVAFWVAAGLPVSFFGMFILATYFGATINVISLFGMIVVVGILVDDGIVISENIYHHYEKGKTRIRAAIDGTMEVVPAVISAVLTTMIAFSAFFYVDGTAGDFFSEMAFIVIATLAVSLVEALIILPSHIGHSKALSHQYKKNKLELALDRYMAYAREKLYRPVLSFVLRYKAFSLAVILALFLMTLGAMQGKIIRISYFPFIDRDNFEVSLKMPAGTRSTVTQDYLNEIRLATQAVNDSLRTLMPNGEAVIQLVEETVGPTINEGKLNIILLSSEIRGISSSVVVNALREKVGPVYDAENLTFGSVSAFGKPVSVSLLSENYEDLRVVKNELKEKMMRFGELRDVVDNDLEGVKEVRLKLKTKAHMLGLNPAQIMQQVRNGFFGYEVQRLQKGEDEVKVWVRYTSQERASLYNLEDMYIRTAQGEKYALTELTDYTIERGPLKINHLDGEREIKVEADLADPNGSAPDAIERIRTEVLDELLAKYPSVSALYEGQNREAQKTLASSKIVLPLVLLLIILVITFTFRSFSQAVTIFLLIPLSLVGVGWGHWLHGLPLSIFSFLGVIALIGVIVNDSLVLVSKMNGYLKEGLDFKNAVFEAGLSRFRAILLTSATTIAGLAPLILEESVQAQFLIPMAIALAYGIVMATVLTLLVLPVLLSILNSVRRYGLWFWLGNKPSQEAVEPAIIELESENED